MNRKSLVILASIFIFQTIMSCDTCNCPSYRRYLVDFQGLDVAAYQRTNGQLAGINGDISVTDLTVVAEVSFEAERLSQNMATFGFQSALACSCAYPTKYQFIDAISAIRILKNEPEESKDISILFGIDDSFDLEWFIENNLFVWDTYEPMVLQLNALENATLTGTMTLTVEIELASGAVLSATTQEITFI